MIRFCVINVSIGQKCCQDSISSITRAIDLSEQRTTRERLRGRSDNLGMDTLESISRDQLYEAVWSTPIVVLSKRFGLSDVGLAKVCRRYQVPRPGRGYWAKLRSGWPEPKTPLPKVTDPKLQVVSLTELPPEMDLPEERFAEDNEVHELIKEEMAREPIAVPASLRSPHPMVAAAVADDDVSEKESRAAQGSRGWSAVTRAHRETVARADIHVSRSLRSRAYRVMDAVLKASLERGYEVWGKPDEYRRSTFLKVLGETFELRVYEPDVQRAHVLTKDEAARKEKYGSVYAPKHDYVRSERLCLQLRESGSTVLWEARDGKKVRVEERVNQLFIAAFRRVDVARKWQRKREEEAWLRREAEERRQAEEQRQQEEKQRREHEQARIRGLLDEAENWRRSRLLRSYLKAVRRTLEEQGRDAAPGSDLERRLSWADGVANDLDPLIPPRPSPAKAKA